MRHYVWKKTGDGTTDNLGAQFQVVVRGCNQGSKYTQDRYIAAGERFIPFLAKEFHLQKLQNISDKHLESWAKFLLAASKSHKYIKNELSAIRFWHRQLPQARFELEDGLKFNKRIGLESTPDGRADRAWTHKELEKMVRAAIEEEKPEIAKILISIYSTGMRLDEAASLRRHEVEAALRTGILSLVNTKGGRPRKIKLTSKGIEVLSEVIKNVPRGCYVFVPVAQKVYVFKEAVQKFIYYHRESIQAPDRSQTGHNLEAGERGALTVHGLRHSYARNEFERLQDEGLDEDQTRETLAEELGHGRPRVTRIYTGGK